MLVKIDTSRPLTLSSTIGYSKSVGWTVKGLMKGKEKPLSETNPYFRDPKLRKKMILISAASSAAIEGIRVPLKVLAKGLRPGWKPPRQKRRS